LSPSHHRPFIFPTQNPPHDLHWSGVPNGIDSQPQSHLSDEVLFPFWQLTRLSPSHHNPFIFPLQKSARAGEEANSTVAHTQAADMTIARRSRSFILPPPHSFVP